MEDLKPNIDINGRYVLKLSKGRGTFGQVWLAYDRANDEDVAIKFYVALDSKGREEFIQEYRIAAKLHHSNLLVTKDYGEWQGHPYLTMKYCDSGSAASLIGNLKPCAADERKIWQFIHDVSAGLAYLHSVKPDPIVHQDIKPDNILIDSNGNFLITDFGISKRIRNTMLKQSTRALKAGAPAYMGPERFSENPEPILASDVWSLGASIYELAEGELPFSGMGGIMMLKGAEIPSLNSGWSENLNDLMHWCIEKETWSRAKAFQIEKIAKTVLDKGQEVSVKSLISQMSDKAASDENKHIRDNDPHATKNQVDVSTKDIGESITNADVNTENNTKTWLRKPITWVLCLLLVVASVATITWLSKREEPMAVEEMTVSVRDSVIETPADNETGTSGQGQVTNEDDKDDSKSNDTKIPSMEIPKNEVQENYIGIVNLGYATWNGGIKKGKPNGTGTLTFTESHRIDSRDPNRRTAEAGERIEGTFINGHLEEGRWYKLDGTTEYILLGE